jgi:hypothetical protein
MTLRNMARGHSPADAADEVRQAFTSLCLAMIDKRLDVLDSLLDDSYTATHITGYVSPKAEWLAQIGSGDFTYHAIDQEATDVDVHDDRATLVSRALYTVTLHGSPGRWRLRSTLDWVRVGDRWKAVRGVSTTA